MNDLALKKMTVAEFLEWDDGTDTRYELVDGIAVAMNPPVTAHGAVMMSLGSLLEGQLKRPCRVLAEVGIAHPEWNDTYFQADLAITCAPISRNPGAVVDPVVLVEVLSQSTKGHDRAVKLPAYRDIGSVQEIALVSLERPHVELWHRDGDRWLVQDLIGDAVAEFRSLGVSVALADIYDGIDFQNR